MAKTNSTAMIALTGAEPMAAFCWMVVSCSPRNRVTQIRVMSASTLAEQQGSTGVDLPAPGGGHAFRGKDGSWSPVHGHVGKKRSKEIRGVVAVLVAPTFVTGEGLARRLRCNASRGVKATQGRLPNVWPVEGVLRLETAGVVAKAQSGGGANVLTRSACPALSHA